MKNVLVKEYSQTNIQDAKLTGASFYTLTFNLGLALLIAGSVFYFITAPVGTLTVLYASIYLIFRFTIIYQSYLRSKLDVKSYYLIDIYEAFSFVGFLAILFYFQISLFMAITAYILRSASTLAFAFLLFQERIPFSLFPGVRTIKVVLKGSILLGALNFVRTVYFLIDQMFLGIMRTPAELGIYAVSVKIIAASNLMTQAFFLSFFPLLLKFTQESKQQYERLLKLGTKYLILGGITFALFLDLFGINIVELFYGVEYVEAAVPIIILGWGLPVRFLVFILCYTLVAKKEYKVLVYIGLLANGINILLDWLLIPSYGVPGVAFATFLTFFIELPLYFFLSSARSFYQIVKTDLFIPFLSLLPCLPVLIFFDRSLLSNLGVIAVIFPCSIFIFKIISLKELKEITSLFMPDLSETHKD